MWMKKKIKGFENYTISNDGVVENIKTQKIKVGTSNGAGNGYLYVDLYNNGKKSRRFIHRLVAEAFIANVANKPMVNHKDGNTKNNNVSNLEWVTASENVSHASNILKVMQQYSKANEKKKRRVVQIDVVTKQIVNTFDSIREAERKTGIKSSYIVNICKGKFYQAFGYHWCYVEELEK